MANNIKYDRILSGNVTEMQHNRCNITFMLRHLLSKTEDVRNIFVTILKKGLTMRQINDTIPHVDRKRD